MDRKYEVYADMFEAIFTGKDFDESRMGEKVVKNTAIADYVWLPLRFDGDMIYIDWHDEWRIEDYE